MDMYTFQHVLNVGEEEKSHMAECLGSVGVDILVECGVWPKTGAHVGPSVPVYCDEFATHLTAVSMAVYGTLSQRQLSSSK